MTIRKATTAISDRIRYRTLDGFFNWKFCIGIATKIAQIGVNSPFSTRVIQSRAQPTLNILVLWQKWKCCVRLYGLKWVCTLFYRGNSLIDLIETNHPLAILLKPQNNNFTSPIIDIVTLHLTKRSGEHYLISLVGDIMLFVKIKIEENLENRKTIGRSHNNSYLHGLDTFSGDPLGYYFEKSNLFVSIISDTKISTIHNYSTIGRVNNHDETHNSEGYSDLDICFDNVALENTFMTIRKSSIDTQEGLSAELMIENTTLSKSYYRSNKLYDVLIENCKTKAKFINRVSSTIFKDIL